MGSIAKRKAANQDERPALDVTNTAASADWLRDTIGRGALSGLFHRPPEIVHVPRVNEDGYVPMADTDAAADGPAQVRPITAEGIATRISYLYRCTKHTLRRGQPVVNDNGVPIHSHALFPILAARAACAAPDLMPHLRTLRGVTHTPIVRGDGSLLTAPGYDAETGILYLPDPTLNVPPVPDAPTDDQVRAAVCLILFMLAGFKFGSDHYRANFIGMLLTPLLRALVGPPYKLHAIEAHQRGSGKTLLARIAEWLHGGVFRVELPEDAAEFRKQVTSILTITTAPVIIFDNAEGTLRSPIISGLLTSNTWGDRPLGATNFIECANDRIWTVTGNNLNITGDLPRRTVRTFIDPGVPRPELRTDFAISNLQEWALAHRGELLHALLTIVRAWVVAGMPLGPQCTSDSYSRWTRSINGILATAGIAGEFDHPDTQIAQGEEDPDWCDFLATVHATMGSTHWTAKELLSKVSTGNGTSEQRPIPIDALPEKLAERAGSHPNGPAGVAKSLGHWLKNRKGRFAGPYVVREVVGAQRDNTKSWRVEATPDSGDQGIQGICSSPRAQRNQNEYLDGPEVIPQIPQTPGKPFRINLAGTVLDPTK